MKKASVLRKPAAPADILLPLSRHALNLPQPTSGKLSGKLSPVQERILGLLADGMNTKSIASVVGLSKKTVEYHRGRIQTILHIFDLASLTKAAIRMGLSKL